MAFVLGNPASIPTNSLVVINVKSSDCAIFGKLNNAYQEGNGDWRAVLSWSAEFADNLLYLNGGSKDYPLEAADCISPANSSQIAIFENALAQGGSRISYNATSVALAFTPMRLPVGTQYWYVSYGGGMNSILSAVEANSAIDFERFEAGNYFESNLHPFIDGYASSVASAIQPFRSQYTPTRLPAGTQYWHIGYRGGLNSILSGTESNSAIDQERFDAINYFPSNNHLIINNYALAIQNVNLNMKNCKLDGRIDLDDYYYDSIFPAPPFLYLDRGSDTVGHLAGADVLLSVASNTAWTVTVDVDWLLCDTQSGSGNKDMYFEYEDNPTDDERIAHITVSTMNASSVVFTLHQLGIPVE